MAVEAVVLRKLEGRGLRGGLVFGGGAGGTLHHHVAAELAGDDDEGAI